MRLVIAQCMDMWAMVLQECPRQVAAWRAVIDSLKVASVQRALHALVLEQRDGQRLRAHLPLFRDIQLVALQQFARAVDRDQLEIQYAIDFERLPPRIAAVLPVSDAPPRVLTRACRKIFIPLDVL